MHNVKYQGVKYRIQKPFLLAAPWAVKWTAAVARTRAQLPSPAHDLQGKVNCAYIYSFVHDLLFSSLNLINHVHDLLICFLDL